MLNYLDKITNLHCSACFTSQLSENKQDVIAGAQVPTNIQIRNSGAKQECITPSKLCWHLGLGFITTSGVYYSTVYYN